MFHLSGFDAIVAATEQDEAMKPSAMRYQQAPAYATATDGRQRRSFSKSSRAVQGLAINAAATRASSSSPHNARSFHPTTNDRDQLFAYLSSPECLIFSVSQSLNKHSLNSLLRTCDTTQECIEIITTLNDAYLQYAKVEELVAEMKQEKERRRNGSGAGRKVGVDEEYSPLFAKNITPTSSAGLGAPPPAASSSSPYILPLHHPQSAKHSTSTVNSHRGSLKQHPATTTARSARATSFTKPWSSSQQQQQQQQNRPPLAIKSLSAQNSLRNLNDISPSSQSQSNSRSTSRRSSIAATFWRADSPANAASNTATDALLSPTSSTKITTSDRDALFSYLSSPSCLIFSTSLKLGKKDLNHLLRFCETTQQCIDIIRKMNDQMGLQYESVDQLAEAMKDLMEKERMIVKPVVPALLPIATVPVAVSPPPLDSCPPTSRLTARSSWITPADRDTLFSYLASPTCLIFRSPATLKNRQLNMLLRVGGSTSVTIELINSLNEDRLQYGSVEELAQGMKEEVDAREKEREERENEKEVMRAQEQLLHQHSLQATPLTSRQGSVASSGIGSASFLSPQHSATFFTSSASYPPSLGITPQPSLLRTSSDPNELMSPMNYHQSQQQNHQQLYNMTLKDEISSSTTIGGQTSRSSGFQPSKSARDQLFSYLAQADCLIFRESVKLGKKQLNQMLGVCAAPSLHPKNPTSSSLPPEQQEFLYIQSTIELIAYLNKLGLQYATVADLIVGMKEELLLREETVPVGNAPPIVPTITSIPVVVEPVPVIVIPTSSPTLGIILRHENEDAEEDEVFTVETNNTTVLPPKPPPLHPILHSHARYLPKIFSSVPFISRMTELAAVHWRWREAVRSVMRAEKGPEKEATTDDCTLSISTLAKRDAFLRTLTLIKFDPTRIRVDADEVFDVVEMGRSLWCEIKKVEIEKYLDHPMPTLPCLHTLLTSCTHLRSLHLNLVPFLDTHISTDFGVPNPYVSVFTPGILTNGLSGSMTSLSLIQTSYTSQFSPIHNTLIFTLIATKLVNLKELRYEWLMTNQLGSSMPREYEEEDEEDVVKKTRNTDGRILHLDSLLNLTSLSLLQLCHIELTQRAGEILHTLSTRYALRKVVWGQRQAKRYGSLVFDRKEEVKEKEWRNDLSGFHSLLSYPASLISSFTWSQPSGVLMAADVRCMLALPYLEELRVDARKSEYVNGILAVFATCQQGAQAPREGRVATNSNHIQTKSHLRSLDITIISDTFSSPDSHEHEPCAHLPVPPWMISSASELNSNVWCCAISAMSSLTALTLRQAIMTSIGMKAISTGLHQLKSLTLDSCASLSSEAKEILEQTHATLKFVLHVEAGLLDS